MQYDLVDHNSQMNAKGEALNNALDLNLP